MKTFMLLGGAPLKVAATGTLGRPRPSVRMQPEDWVPRLSISPLAGLSEASVIERTNQPRPCQEHGAHTARWRFCPGAEKGLTGWYIV
jgi:hypothetical protein